MLYVDIPTQDDLRILIEAVHPHSVSIFMPTTPVSGEVSGDPIRLKNQVKAALDQLRAAGATNRELGPLEEMLDDLVDDMEFWRYQARSLAIFATPETIFTFRVPNHFTEQVVVSDRFHVKPLTRTITFPNTAWLLALADESVRLLEISPGLPTTEVKVADMPKSAADHANKASIKDRSPSGRFTGGEGVRKRYQQYCHAIDRAIRPVLAGHDIPLIVVADVQIGAIFRAVNSYAHLAPRNIPHTPIGMTDQDMVERAREVLDEVYAEKAAAWRQLYDDRFGAGRATTDIAQAARAATIGAVEALAADIDEVVSGTVDADGAVHFSGSPSADCYGVIDETMRRAFLTGARIRAGRKDDMPDGKPLAAILRWAV
jgi:hypothetical protein